MTEEKHLTHINHYICDEASEKTKCCKYKIRKTTTMYNERKVL